MKSFSKAAALFWVVMAFTQVASAIAADSESGADPDAGQIKVTGSAYYCYQTYEQGLEGAKNDATVQAGKICAFQLKKAVRESAWRRVQSPEYCQVSVRARFRCVDDRVEFDDGNSLVE